MRRCGGAGNAAGLVEPSFMSSTIRATLAATVHARLSS
jgi:hypothetical protein